MNKPKRPCLTCRMLFIPTKENPSYCARHKPTKKKNKLYNPYNSTEYRKNRAYLKANYKRCFKCMTPGTPFNKLEVDHIIPVSKGGGHNLSNLRILCKKCHKLRQGVDPA